MGLVAESEGILSVDGAGSEEGGDIEVIGV